MIVRTALLVAITSFGVSAPSLFAADAEPTPAFTTNSPIAAPFAGDVDWTLTPIRVTTDASRRNVLKSLYGGLATLNGVDAYLTSRACANGSAIEKNPLMRDVIGNTAALWAVKGAATAGSIFFAERLWHQQHRKAAITAMLITNGLMAGTAAKNLTLAQSR
jgi:Domain of unknown function (DUF5658)